MLSVIQQLNNILEFCKTRTKNLYTVKLRSLELGSLEYLPSLELIAQSRQNSYIIYIVLPRIARTPIARTLEPDLWSLRQKYSENHTFSVEHKKTSRHVLNK